MESRAERREEIKLRIEYLKLALSVAGLVLIILAGLQWRIATQTNIGAIYQKMNDEWIGHLKTLVEKPELRPYFEASKPLNANDPNEQLVLAFADVRLSVEDQILGYARQTQYAAEFSGWQKTFAQGFKTSPVLCKRVAEVQDSYYLIFSVAREACGLK